MADFLKSCHSFYFPGLLVGPYLEFANYQALVDGTTFKTNTSEGSGDVGSKRLIPKGRKRVAYRKMITGLVFLYAFVTYSGRLNYGVAVKSWFADQPLWYRYVVIPIIRYNISHIFLGLASSKLLDSSRERNTMQFGL